MKERLPTEDASRALLPSANAAGAVRSPLLETFQFRTDDIHMNPRCRGDERTTLGANRIIAQGDTFTVGTPEIRAASSGLSPNKSTRNVAEDPRLSTLCLFATPPLPPRRVGVFSTLDAPVAMPTAHPVDAKSELVMDAQAYLQALPRKPRPGSSLHRAWERFYRRYNPLVRRAVRACRIRRALVEDCVQEIWLEIIRALPSLRYDPHRDRFPCWLYVLSRRKAMQFLRRETSNSTISVGNLEHCLCERELAPAETYERRRSRRIVRSAIAELGRRHTASDYQLLHLHWIEGHSAPEVATRLNLNARQFWDRHYRVKRKLRRLLEGRNICEVAVS